MSMPFQWPADYAPAVQPPVERPERSLWFVFRASELLVTAAPAVALPHCIHPNTLGMMPERIQYLGVLGEEHCFSAEAAADTAARTNERSRECTGCGLVAYPRLAPAVMGLVRRGRELLLARSPRFPEGMYSALAGFVEPGETLEQCLEREVYEEVGIHVCKARYFASQPWPFPHSLMIAFFAEYDSGDLRADGAEIEDAKWFDVRNFENLPRLPARISIARRLIDAAKGEMLAS